MPATTPQRPRGFVPRFRVGYSDSHLRVSDTERAEVADQLGQHYSDGRLDRAEFDERVSQAMGAKTRADLAGLFDDLPDLGHDAAAPADSAGNGRRRVGRARPARPARPARHRGALFPLFVLILAVIAVNAIAHALAAWLWLGFFAAIIVIAAVAVSRARH